MIEEAAPHEERVRLWLDRVGYRPQAGFSLELLKDGLSGAFAYRIVSGDEALVLKVVLADSHPLVAARGRREALFYTVLAGSVPLVTPGVVGLYGPAHEGCAVLLREYRRPERVASWDEGRFESVAQQLARLHAAFWDKSEELRRFEWLKEPQVDLSGFREFALASWRGLWAQERLRPVFPAPVITRIERAVELVTGAAGEPASPDYAPPHPAPQSAPGRPTASERALPHSAHEHPALHLAVPELPVTLCHGDAHHENLLVREDGAWVWADWQEVGLGYGPDDVSFFFQRAVAAGGKADLARMLRAYRAELERKIGKAVAFAALWRRAVFSEVTTRLVHWPAYLQQAPEERVRTHVSRVMELLSELDLGA